MFILPHSSEDVLDADVVTITPSACFRLAAVGLGRGRPRSPHSRCKEWPFLAARRLRPVSRGLTTNGQGKAKEGHSRTLPYSVPSRWA